MENDGDLEQYSKYVMLLFMLMSLIGLVMAFKKQIVASIFNVLCKRVHDRLIHQKNELFKQLRDDGGRPLKLLEIGSGPGMNFKYYPERTILTCLEPNPHHEKYLLRNLAKNNPKIRLKEFVCGNAEDLSRFKEDEFDAVVETLVLCSVTSTEAVLQEIKRVLKPGGKFYFLDHVADHGHNLGSHGNHKSTKRTEEMTHGTLGTCVSQRSHTAHESHTAHGTHESHESHDEDVTDGTDQHCVIWFSSFFHCIFHRILHKNVNDITRNRDIAEAIKNARFSQMEITNFKMQMPFLPWKSACIYGTAMKF